MKLTDEQIEKMALDEYPISSGKNLMGLPLRRISFVKGAKQARDIYEKEIQRLKLEILTMTGTIDGFRDELKRLK